MPRPATEDDIRRIYRATLDELYAFVARRCDGDRDLAEDIVQEAWLRAVRSWQDGIPESPIAWLTTVARNLLANHRRRPAPEPLDERLAATGDEGQADERRSMLGRALARLPLPQMRLLEAFHLERRKVVDIANAQGVSERAVEGRLRRARQLLRRQIELDRDFEGESR